MSKAVDDLFVDPRLLKLGLDKCEQKVCQEPENLVSLRTLAELYRKLGRLADASAIYERILGLDPRDREAAYTRGILTGAPVPDAPAGVRTAPYVFIKNFLPPDFHNGLIPYVESVQDQFVPALVGNQAEYKPEMRKTMQYSGVWEGRQRFKDLLLGVLPDAVQRLYFAPFEYGNIAIQIRAYLDGHYFRTHMDLAPIGPGSLRMLNFVYYFHQIPRPYSGGELLLFDTNIEANTYTNSRFTMIVPEDNSIILFPCAYYHSVIPVRCPSQAFLDSRFVINGHVSKPGPVPTSVTG